METIPVFDFANPWVAIIQLTLIYLLPRLTGLVTDKLTASGLKIAILGALMVVASTLTFLLDVAIAQSWSELDYTALINVAVNAAITFFLAQGAYTGIIKPLGQSDRDAASTAIQVVGASDSRVLAASKAAHPAGATTNIYYSGTEAEQDGI